MHRLAAALMRIRALGTRRDRRVGLHLSPLPNAQHNCPKTLLQSHFLMVFKSKN